MQPARIREECRIFPPFRRNRRSIVIGQTDLDRQAVFRRSAAGRAALGEAHDADDVRTPSTVLLKQSKMTISNLDFFYGEAQALKGVTLNLPEKQVTGIIGPSGCGKSTLLRVLNRIYDMYPDQRATGEVRLDGEDILGLEVDVNLLRSRVGMVFQQATAFPMSIFDNVAFGATICEHLSRTQIHERVEQSLIRAALWPEVKDRLREPACDISIGQQQRLCIARALATLPEVILLDEPTSALDPPSTSKIEELVAELKHDVTIVMITHNIEQAARCADQVAFFYLGEMVEAGATAQMFSAPRQRSTLDYVSGRFG
jgi:phosphate transport system ATP-binding protein